MQVALPHKFTARLYQMPFFEAMDRDGKLRASLVWHRRAGKDKVMVNWAIDRAMERVGTYYHIFPTLTQGRHDLWDSVAYDKFNPDAPPIKYLDHFPPELIARKNESEMRIEFHNGSAWQIRGSDYPDSLRGANQAGACFSEYSYMHPSSWDIVRPILRENGGWAVFGFTPCGNNHAKTLYDMALSDPDWFAQKLTIADTGGVITQEDIAKDRAEGMSEEMIQQEYYCSFTSSASGAYYLAAMTKLLHDNHITSVPYDARLPVHTYWDLGRTDSTAVIFVQLHPREYRIIDYYESSNEMLQHYLGIIKDKGYNYGNHGAPHDIEVTDYTALDSRINIARGFGVKFQIVPKLSIEEGHNAVRSILPMCYFDKDKARVLVEHLNGYCKKWNRQLMKHEDTPVENQHIHGADAFRYFAVDVKRLAASLSLDNKPVTVRTGLSRIDNRHQPQRPRWMGVN